MRFLASLPALSTIVLGGLALPLGCTPELSDAPFACSTDGACPEGYACQSAVCVLEGAGLSTARPKRVTWINSGEMFWLAAKDQSGGAVLVVNDGFSPGAHGIYEIRVTPDGAVGDPRPLILYGDQFPMSSSVVALSDGRYGVVTLSFPSIDGDKLTLKVQAIERDAPEGAAPAIETLYTDEEPFLGGAEPAYVNAVAGDGRIDLAWTRPASGGRVEVLRLEKQGSLWQPAATVMQALPPNILPLSGDCMLFPVSDDKLVLRVGFEEFALAEVDFAAGTISPFATHDGLPIFAWPGKALVQRVGDADEATETSRVSYALTNLTGTAEEAVDDAGVLQDGTDVYAALPFEGGAVFAPMSSDPGFPELGVGFRSATAGLKQVASIKRQSSDRIYSARALAAGGKAFVAWTEFHESLMDLWVAAAPLTMAREAPAAGSGEGSGEAASARRVARFPNAMGSVGGSVRSRRTQ